MNSDQILAKPTQFIFKLPCINYLHILSFNQIDHVYILSDMIIIYIKLWHRKEVFIFIELLYKLSQRVQQQYICMSSIFLEGLK